MLRQREISPTFPLIFMGYARKTTSSYIVTRAEEISILTQRRIVEHRFRFTISIFFRLQFLFYGIIIYINI